MPIASGFTGALEMGGDRKSDQVPRTAHLKFVKGVKMAAKEQIVRKSEFARLCNVSRSRVSQWLAAGQIGREAIIGERRNARIHVAIARQHLRERLDPSQRFGLRGLSTVLDGSAAVPHAQIHIEQRIKQEKLRQAELTTIRAEERDRLARGTYILAAAAKEENGRLAARLFEAFDGSLVDFAAALAAQYELPVRDVLHCLRAEMLKVRERVSREYSARVDDEPEIEDAKQRPSAWPH
jgi:hypothetical protein